MSNQPIEILAQKMQGVKDRFERLEKDVRGLKDILNVHDNWHSMIRGWIGQEVLICDRTGSQTKGRLKWSDRYNLCVAVPPEGRHGIRTRMYTKGGINWIENWSEE